MKSKKYYLILCLVAAILCPSAFGQAKSAASGAKPASPGRDNPTLAGIEQLYVNILASYSVTHEGSRFINELRAGIEERIAKAGIKIYSGPISASKEQANIPVLKINLDAFSLDEGRRNVFLVQTFLSAGIYIGVPPILFRIDVWMRGATVEPTSAQNTAAAVTGLVLKQVEAFIGDYLSANPQSGRSLGTKASGNVPVTVAEKRVRPTAKPPATEHKFVASKNSRVFHKPQCSSAKRILPKNLVVYRSRTEAVNSGKRPCKRCKP